MKGDFSTRVCLLLFTFALVAAPASPSRGDDSVTGDRDSSSEAKKIILERETRERQIDELHRKLEDLKREMTAQKKRIRAQNLDIKRCSRIISTLEHQLNLMEEELARQEQENFERKRISEILNKKLIEALREQKRQEKQLKNARKEMRNQGKVFKTKDLKVSRRLNAGVLLLESIRVNNREINTLDVSKTSVVLAQRGRILRGFALGRFGQVIYFVNIGDAPITVESLAPRGNQKIKLARKKEVLEVDAAMIFIFDGLYWRSVL